MPILFSKIDRYEGQSPRKEIQHIFDYFGLVYSVNIDCTINSSVDCLKCFQSKHKMELQFSFVCRRGQVPKITCDK